MICVGIREGELADEIGTPAVGEPVDQLAGHPLDQIVLPARERLLREGARRRGRGSRRCSGSSIPSMTCLPSASPKKSMMMAEENVSLSRSTCAIVVVAVHHEDGL